MAVKNYRYTYSNDGIFGILAEVDQSQSYGDGWTVGTRVATVMAELAVGLKQISTTFNATAKPASFITTNPSNALKTPTPLLGTFANTAWTFTFNVLATTSSAQAGRMRLRVFKSLFANGSSATELTSATQVGTTTVTIPSGIGSGVNSVVTWTPGTTITLNNEYLFFVIAWEITTAGNSGSSDVNIATGQASAGTFINTPDFVPLVPYLDNFNRASLGSNWALGGAAYLGNLPSIVNNELVGTKAGAVWTPGSTWAANFRVRARFRFADKTVARPLIGILNASDQGYCLEVNNTGVNMNQIPEGVLWTIGAGAFNSNGEWAYEVTDVPVVINNVVDSSLGLLGQSTASQQVAQSFVAQGMLTRVDVALAKQSNPFDNVVIEVQLDNAGTPSGSVVAQVASISAFNLTNVALHQQYSCAIPLTSGATYWIVMRRDGAINATNYYKFYNNVTAWSGHPEKVMNGGVWGAALSTSLSCAISFGGAMNILYRDDGTSAWTTVMSEPDFVHAGPWRGFVGFNDTVSGQSRLDNFVIEPFVGPHLIIPPDAITASFSVSGVLTKTSFVPDPIVPASVATTFSMSGKVVALRAVVPATANFSTAVSGSVAPLRRVAPASITASFSVSGSITSLRAVRPTTNITFTNIVSGAVVKGGVKVVAPAGITFTNTVSGSIRTLHVVRPTTSITFTNTVSGSIRALRRIAPTTNVTFTNAVSGSIQKSVVRAVVATSTFTATMSGSVRTLHVVRPTTNITFTNTVTGAVTVRKRVSAAITYTNTVSGNVTKPALFKPITAATINASSTVSGKVTVLRAVRPTTNITFTNSVNGITQTLRRITPAQITFTNAVSGSIQKGFPRAVLPANITYTNTVSGVVVPLRGIRPTSITFTNVVSGSVRVLRAVRPITNVAFTNTVSGGVTTLRRVTANITYTNSVNGIVRKLVAGITAQITFTNTVSGSVRTLRRVSATITFTNTVIGSLIHAGFVPVWPTQITFTNSVTGSIVARRGITTAQATFTNTVSGSIVKQTRLTFGTITYTNTVSGVVVPLRAIRPTSITYTNTVNGKIVVVRAIRLAGITATFSTTGRVSALRVVKPANITFLATITGFVITKGSTAIVTTPISFTCTVTGRVTALKQITTAQATFTNMVSGRVSAIHTLAATITFTNSVSGYIQKGFTRVIAPITPITFTAVMTGSVGAKRPILPAQITYTNTVSANTARTGTIVPSLITFTNSVSGLVGRRRYVVPASITYTNTVTGTARRARGIFPATITYTNTVNGRVLRLAGIRPVAITFTVNTSGNIGKLVHLGSLITWTNTVTATLHMAHRFGVIPIATGRTTQGTRGRAFATGNGNSTPAATRGRVFSQ